MMHSLSQVIWTNAEELLAAEKAHRASYRRRRLNAQVALMNLLCSACHLLQLFMFG
jgi:hypothetical protein